MRPEKDCLITVLITSYNTGGFLKQCLDSIAGQHRGCMPYRILFIDDASQDNSWEVAEPYKKVFAHSVFLRNKENKGLIRCCNEALSIIETPYFMRVDGDDNISPEAMNKI